MTDSDSNAEEIVREYNELATARSGYDSLYQQVAQRIWPAYSNTFGQGQTPVKNTAPNYSEIFDSTATIGLNRFAAILDSLLTPRNSTWHKLESTDPYLNKQRRVALWLDVATRACFKYRYAPTANFSSQNNQYFKSLGAFGTSTMFTDRLFGDSGLRYRNVHLGECYFRENHQGLIDEVYRYFPLSARQAAKKFGDKLPEQIRSQLKTTTGSEKEFNFIHCVKSNNDRDPGRLDHRGMPFKASYVFVQGKQTIEQGGFTSFPYAVSRYEQSPGESSGDSPAMSVLPAIKVLFEQKKTILKAGHRAADPVLLMHDDGIIDTMSLKPGAMNAGGVSHDGKLLVHALPAGRVDIGKELMDDERQVINDAFLVNLFQILTETPTMTATEVMERTREKGILLAPTVGRQNSEYLGNLIPRELDLLIRQGLVPPPPPEFLEAGGEYQIIYDSPLSRAQRAEEAAGLMRSIELALKVAAEAQNPAPLDHFNWDVITPEIAAIHGVPARWMNSMEEIKAMRKGRQQAAEQQQMIDAAPGAAAMSNAVTKARAVAA